MTIATISSAFVFLAKFRFQSDTDLNMPLIDYESDEGQPSNTTAAPELEQEDNEQPDASNPFNIVQSTSSATSRAHVASSTVPNNAAPFVLEKVWCLLDAI